MLQTAPSRLLLACTLCLVVGCGGGGESRNEETATIDGKASYKGTAVPEKSGIIFEDKAKGVTMRFAVAADGKYSVTSTAELPVGKYNVAVVPPATDGPADYDAAMSSPDTAAEPKKDDFPVPEKFRSPATSGKSVEVKAGSQTLDIDFGA